MRSREGLVREMRLGTTGLGNWGCAGAPSPKLT
jgi:hypothetical protein